MSENQGLFDYITASPTAPHAALETARRLREAGYTPLTESGAWRLVRGGKYYVTRGAASLIAFRVPGQDPTGVMMVASHSDSPTFAVTPTGTAVVAGKYTRLTVEKYGGMLCATWLDRPLGVAGILEVRSEGGTLVRRTVKIDRDLVMIPSVAIHMNRVANENASYNPTVDMQPLYGGLDTKHLLDLVAEEAGVKREDIVSHQLWLYNRQAPVVYGAAGEFIGSARLDDLACSYASLTGFLAAKESAAMPLYALFDNEEVGSATYGGAGSDFLVRTLSRIAHALGMEVEAEQRMLANGFLVSADNAHAVHPNHPEYADPAHAPTLNGGVVVKYNANRRYATDVQSAAVFCEICRRAGVPVQPYCNRPDIPGGSTLGVISVTQLSVPTVDIGLAQLSMHSSYETMGSLDLRYMIEALTAFYGSALCIDEAGNLLLS
jgi:aspartyl aminopeptidase